MIISVELRIEELTQISSQLSKMQTKICENIWNIITKIGFKELTNKLLKAIGLVDEPNIWTNKLGLLSDCVASSKGCRQHRTAQNRPKFVTKTENFFFKISSNAENKRLNKEYKSIAWIEQKMHWKLYLNWITNTYEQ